MTSSAPAATTDHSARRAVHRAELPAQPAVELRALGHSYGPRPALRGVSLTVRPAEVFGILGPNGGGKSTLFRVLSTQLKPATGSAFVHGHDVVKSAAAARAAMGVVFQSPALDPYLTAAENLMHQGHLYGLKGTLLASRIRKALEIVGLEDRADDRTGRLSGGQRRRVEIAKALLHDPALLLLDEPGTGLDPGARRALMDHLAALRDAADVTSLLTTHVFDEADRCDRLAILHKGQIVATGTPAELKAKCGAGLLTLEGPEPVRLQKGVEERFALQPTLEAGAVRIEVPVEFDGSDQGVGPRLLARVAAAFPGLVNGARLGPPTLEDVFLRFTGQLFESVGQDGEAA